MEERNYPMKANEPKDREKEMDMFREEVSIDLDPFTVVVVAVAVLSPGILLSVLTASAMLNVELATH